MVLMVLWFIYGFNDAFISWIRILHLNSKSSVMNGGLSTGYFELNRSTRHGDPLAPNLFILIIEILIGMVRENEKIKGIEINGHQFNQCVFADDTTYFLHDLESLAQLKKTIATFSNFTSLQVNYEKSEIAGIGASKDTELLDIGIKTLNLTREAIRILVYFTYNKQIHKKLNFDRALNNFKQVINMWKNRTLSLYGKTIILKSLAIPKLLYVCSMSEVPSVYTDEVKKCMCKFLWKGTPKIKYSVIIDGLYKG